MEIKSLTIPQPGDRIPRVGHSGDIRDTESVTTEGAADGSTRSSAVAGALRTAILSGQPAPGAALREVALAEEYGVSRRTVREALLELSREGIVIHRHNHGASVRRFTSGDVADLYRVRRILECEGARAAPVASDSGLAQVTAAMRRLEDAARCGITSGALAWADASFHGSVIGLVGSERIDGFYAHIGSQMALAITLLQQEDATTSLHADEVVAEHRAIHRALLARNAFEAQRLILDHISHSEGRLRGQPTLP